MESKDANVCDTLREPLAYTVTFLWFYFHCHLEGLEVCF